MSRVLYLGMANDIMSPLLLVPDFDIVYVICKLDRAFAKDKTWEGQKEDIKQILESGNNECSFSRGVYLKYDEDTPVYYLEGASKIIKESDDGYCWRLDFIYDRKPRELVYYHHREFIAEWPKEIYQIDHVMSMGATFPFREMILQEMIFSRCTYAANYYDGDHSSCYEIDFPYQTISCHRKTIRCSTVQGLRLNRPVTIKIMNMKNDVKKKIWRNTDGGESGVLNEEIGLSTNGCVTLNDANIKAYLFLEGAVDDKIRSQLQSTERLLYEILLEGRNGHV